MAILALVEKWLDKIWLHSLTCFVILFTGNVVTQFIVGVAMFLLSLQLDYNFKNIFSKKCISLYTHTHTNTNTNSNTNTNTQTHSTTNNITYSNSYLTVQIYAQTFNTGNCLTVLVYDFLVLLPVAGRTPVIYAFSAAYKLRLIYIY